jgi:molybdopterin-guanine dinucleotide biosynthesis protein A
MGQAKQGMAWGGARSMGDRMVDLARAVCTDVRACGPPNALPGIAHLADPSPWQGHGPLVGIAAALRSGLASRWLILPCDMPTLDVTDLDRLIAIDAPIVCFAVDGQLEPMPMCVASSAADSVSEYLTSGGRRLSEWIATHNPSTIQLDARHAKNINRPEDLCQDV